MKMIKLREGYEVYTREVGTGPKKILLLHGGPGGCHECFEVMEAHMDLDKYTLIYYDQLGSHYSDDIDDESLLTLERYVDEVEQVRKELGLDDFILLGHSWGGMLAIEYALKYQDKGYLSHVIISNMTASNDAYEKSIAKVREKWLTEEELDYLKAIEEKGDYSDTRYSEIVYGKLYPNCIIRCEELPKFMSDDKLSKIVYNKFQGDNEFVVTGDLKDWDRFDDLHRIEVKTLVIGATYDTMSISDKKRMVELMPNAELMICKDGGHFAYWDDPVTYHEGLQRFLEGER
jgi:proline iminopeptidase